MSYLELMKKLSKENKGYIVIMRSGVFFTTIGANAIKLSKLFGLKLLCISEGICKCSFPKTVLEKYTIKMKKSNYSYLIYDYKKEGFEDGLNYKIITKIDGKLNEEERNCLDCTKCDYNRNQKINIINKTLRQLNELLKEDYKENE